MDIGIEMRDVINYGHKKRVTLGFDDAVSKVKEELQKEGFGVLTEIDVKSTLKKKLDVDFGDYVILGACNPPLALKALTAEMDLGLMLPCNVIVYREGKSTVVASISPVKQMEKVGNKRLEGIAREVESRLTKIIDRV